MVAALEVDGKIWKVCVCILGPRCLVGGVCTELSWSHVLERNK